MKLKDINGKTFIHLIFIFLIFFIDRISKIIVINFEKDNFTNEIFSSKFLNIQLFWNKGIAFGLFSFDKSHFYDLLTAVILAIVVLIGLMIIKSSGVKKYALLMIFGGALGNLYDRIFFKAVPDFIDFHIGNFHWFIFNVADIFISLGVFFMILFEFVGNSKKESEDEKY